MVNGKNCISWEIIEQQLMVKLYCVGNYRTTTVGKNCIAWEIKEQQPWEKNCIALEFIEQQPWKKTVLRGKL